MSSNQELITKLKGYALRSEEIENALREVPRGLFVPEEQAHRAYENFPVPIGGGQTILQPFAVVVMMELLDVDRGHKVLKLGAGSGWQAAILGYLAGMEGKVYAMEIRKKLAEMARKNKEKTMMENVEIIEGDGTLGLEKEAPFDRIIITAATPKVPPPLKKQLKEGGKMVAPIGSMMRQRMVLFEKKRMGLKELRKLGHYRFTPLVGRHGFRCKMW